MDADEIRRINPKDEIRRINPKDEGTLFRFFMDLSIQPEVTKYFHPHPFDRKTAAEIASHSGKDVYIALFSGEEIIGYAMLRGLDEGYRTPSFGVAVGPRHQGRGVGSRLLTESLRLAFQFGAAEVMLKVHPENLKALTWYRRVGFRECDQQPDGQIVLRLRKERSK